MEMWKKRGKNQNHYCKEEMNIDGRRKEDMKNGREEGREENDHGGENEMENMEGEKIERMEENHESSHAKP